MKLLLDTNVIIEHLRSGVLGHLSGNDDVLISVITEAELLRYSHLSHIDTEIIEQLLAKSNLVLVDSTVARIAARIGQTRKTKLPDLLIAATALVLNARLVTYNIKDFRGIPKLTIVTPQDISARQESI